MKKSKACTAALLAAALYPATSFAENSLTATITVASDYMADGVSATDNKPALQGGIDYEHDSGIYAGIWSSNVDNNEKDTPDLELDYAVGFKHALTDNVSYDIGVTQYTYHTVDHPDHSDYTEWYTGITFMENTNFYYYYSDDDKVWDGLQRRYILTHEQPVTDTVSLLFTAEHLDYEKSIGDDYNAYQAGVNKNWMDTDFTLSYWHNTIHDGDATTDNRFVLEISKEFDLLDAFGHHKKTD
ncbi:MAG TPA: TorF family putative porin [Pseudomonadales bacterium]|nr:TorF family putative porin [Pseudomonadales bacterium]